MLLWRMGLFRHKNKPGNKAGNGIILHRNKVLTYLRAP